MAPISNVKDNKSSIIEDDYYEDDDYDEEYDDEILVFKLKDSDHGELLVHLKEEECKALTEKCKILVGKFINSYTD